MSKAPNNVWGELDSLCRKVRAALYEKHDERAAARYQVRLEDVLARLPKHERAILREEGQALLHELRGEITQAIMCRRREIRLMTRLHRSVSDSIAAGDYDAATGHRILAGRDLDALAQRRTIVGTLQLRAAARKSSRVPLSRGSKHKSTDSKSRTAIKRDV